MSDRQRNSTPNPRPHRTGTPGSPLGPSIRLDLFTLVPPPAPPRTQEAPPRSPRGSAQDSTSPGPAQEPSGEPAGDPTRATAEGAEWLASASALPESVHALWRHHPHSPTVLPCGTAFDVVSAAPLLGRRLLDQLWSSGPGSGPVAVHRGRLLLFAAPGTAHRLPALMCWSEWGDLFRTYQGCRRQEGQGAGERGGGRRGHGEQEGTDAFPPLLCHGPGDLVTVPAPRPTAPAHPSSPPSASPSGPASPAPSASPPPSPSPLSFPLTFPAATGRSHWLVAPDTRTPWLPGPDVLLWSCVRAHRTRGPEHTGPSPAGRSGGFRAGRSPLGGRGTDFRNRGS